MGGRLVHKLGCVAHHADVALVLNGERDEQKRIARDDQAEPQNDSGLTGYHHGGALLRMAG
jgi:hypothetical protein